MDKRMIEEMLKLDIEQSVSGYSAFINDMRISKAKPLSVSKTVISLDCPKKYIYEAVCKGHNDPVGEKGDCGLRNRCEHITQAVKDASKKIMNDISSDILIVNTKEYGNIEVVPVERLQEIIQTLEVNG